MNILEVVHNNLEKMAIIVDHIHAVKFTPEGATAVIEIYFANNIAKIIKKFDEAENIYNEIINSLKGQTNAS